MAKAKEGISVREFSRRMGVSDTAVRNEIYSKTNKNGCLRAGVSLIKAGSKTIPSINFDIAYAEWVKAGRTIKNEEYHPGHGDASAKEVISDLKQQIQKTVNPPSAGFISTIGKESLIRTGMKAWEAEEVKNIYDAGLKELAYMKALGGLAPVDRVRDVLFEFGKTIKASILQVPARIASRVRAAESDREAQDIMYLEFEALLLTISKGPTQSMAADAKDDFDKDADTEYVEPDDGPDGE